MRMISMVDDQIKSKDSDTLQKFLLDRVLKLRKLSKEMNENAQVQKAQDSLEMAKAPFKKARAKWVAEMEAVELELKSRQIKFNINWDDVFGDENE